MPLGIFETCRRVGITVRAIRHYESLGLLLPRRINGARVYDATEFRTLELLQRFKAMGLSLAECRRGLKWFGQPTSGHWTDERTDLSAFVRSLQQRLDTIDSMLAELHIIRDEAVAARAAGRTA
jgi:DNA-binding transcriptional MerR regulator